MFGISAPEFLALAVIALLVLGPEKLPRYAAEAGRMLRTVRRMAASAQEEVRRELGPEFEKISLDDLNPRTFVSRHLLDDDDFDLDDDPRRRANGSTAYDGRPGGSNGSTAYDGRPGGSSAYDGGHGSAGSAETAEETGRARGNRPPYDADAT
ncbi:MAG: sec-independent translocase [Actinomycetota bacterium]|nr:sec-independent translocase [Actinomycetota bacterium]